jgi:hypothetical protein
MNKKTKLLMTIFTLMLSITFLTGANAKNLQPNVKFSATTNGQCIALPELGPQAPDAELFLGKGMLTISGSSFAVYNPANEYIGVPFYTSDSAVATSGRASLSWSDKNLDLQLSSQAAMGLFVDSGKYNDLFTAGVWPGSDYNQPSSTALTYHGTLKDATGTKSIAGYAEVTAVPLGDPTNTQMFIGLVVFNSDGTVLKAFLWSPTDFTSGQVTLQAANAFVTSVKIN